MEPRHLEVTAHVWRVAGRWSGEVVELPWVPIAEATTLDGLQGALREAVAGFYDVAPPQVTVALVRALRGG